MKSSTTAFSVNLFLSHLLAPFHTSKHASQHLLCSLDPLVAWTILPTAVSQFSPWELARKVCCCCLYILFSKVGKPLVINQH